MKELDINDCVWLGGPLKCKVTNEETGLEEEKIVWKYDGEKFNKSSNSIVS